MAVFNPIVITTAGISLLSQAMAGKGTLTFTSVATSTTVIPYNISNIQAMTALSGIMQTVVPVSAVLKTGNVQVSSIFSNSGVTNAYTANTIGLYAALGNGAQTLFAVAIATTPDNIPVQNDLSPSNFYYQFNIAISDTSQLTVTVPEDGSLPASVFNQMFPGITAPGQNNDGDALVYNASSGAWGYVNTETVFTTVSGSGEFVSLQKTLADDFKQIQLFGKSVQKPTTGAQLFDLKSYVEEVSDAEIVDYKSGEFTLDTSNIQVNTTALINLCPKMVAGNSYLLTGETTSNKKYLYVGSKKWNFGEVFIPDENDLNEQCFFNCTTITSESGEVEYYKDTFKNVMIVEGSTEKPYEVYTGGEAATEPTPDYPLPITSAGNYDEKSEKYEVSIGVTGKNLFDASKVPTKSQGGATVTNNGDGSFTISGSGNSTETYMNIYTILGDDARRILKPGKISISGLTNIRPYFYIQTFNKKGNINAISNNTSINISETDLYSEGFGIRFGFYNDNNANIISGTVKPIVYQSGDGIWVPFQGTQQKVLQIPNPFRGIPVDSGGNYTDAEGQQWLCDYIDRERGKYVQCVQEIVFDGVSLRKKVTNADPAYYSNANYAYISVTGIKSYSNTISNKLKYIGEQINKNIEGIIITGVISISLLNTRTGIVSTDSEQQRVAKINAVLKQWYDEGNPLIVYYQLANPIETDLTSDQIAALNLYTYQGITNIGTDTMPQVGMAIESRGFNLAGDLAQNVIDLQTTVQTQAGEIETLQNMVQSQSSAIAENTEKLNTLGLVGYGRKTASQSGESISLASLIPEWSDTFTSGALYSVYFSVSFSEYDSGDTTFQPYILKSIRNGLQTTITQVELPTVYYQANSGNIIPYSCTFMIATDSDEDVSELEFHVDGNSHNFKDMAVAVYRIR